MNTPSTEHGICTVQCEVHGARANGISGDVPDTYAIANNLSALESTQFFNKLTLNRASTFVAAEMK